MFRIKPTTFLIIVLCYTLFTVYLCDSLIMLQTEKDNNYVENKFEAKELTKGL